MNKLIYILGKRSKRVRAWYYKRSKNKWLWGMFRYIDDINCEEFGWKIDSLPSEADDWIWMENKDAE